MSNPALPIYIERSLRVSLLSLTHLLLFQAVLCVVERREPNVSEMNKLGEELAQKLDEIKGDAGDARQKQKTTNDRYEKVRRNLLENERMIEAQINMTGRFMDALEQFDAELNRMEETILDEPIGEDPQVLKKQLGELKVWILS